MKAPSPVAARTSPPPDLTAGRALQIQVLVERSTNTDAVILAQTYVELLADRHPRTLRDASLVGADTRADVTATINVRIDDDSPGGPRVPGASNAVVTATVEVTDLFGVEIARRSIIYPGAFGPGPQHWARLLEACSDEELDAYARRPADERARAAVENAAAASRRAEDEAQRAREADDRLWREGWLTADCLPPKTANSCHLLETFVQRRTESPHIDEARRALEMARPALTRLKEQQHWENAYMDCRRPEISKDCDAVSAYLVAFPNGPHAHQAKRLLRRIRPAIERLRRADRAPLK